MGKKLLPIPMLQQSQINQPQQMHLPRQEKIKMSLATKWKQILKQLKKKKHEYQFKKFLDILKQVHINLPFVEALQQISNYAKFLKDMMFRRTRIGEFETATTIEACLALMHNKVPAKRTNPRSFTIPYSIGNLYSDKALCDLGASINLMPKSVFQN
ncbi:hypothetical protein V6N12_034571 [Hibiscus sabdariffa]|uniref:Retrotransposon gag domain-containing protein n=1 Tax=Hibiscus sabdariffa TaxID=183260 RepID=A0ABR2DHJ4_9ROSI